MGVTSHVNITSSVLGIMSTVSSPNTTAGCCHYDYQFLDKFCLSVNTVRYAWQPIYVTNVWMPCMLNLVLQFVIACMKWYVVNIPYYCVIVYCLLMLPLASCHGNCCVTMYSSSLSFLQSSYPERLLWFARQLFLQPQLWLPSVSRLLKVWMTSTALIHISVRCVYSIWLYNVLCLSVAWST